MRVDRPLQLNGVKSNYKKNTKKGKKGLTIQGRGFGLWYFGIAYNWGLAEGCGETEEESRAQDGKTRRQMDTAQLEMAGAWMGRCVWLGTPGGRGAPRENARW